MSDKTTERKLKMNMTFFGAVGNDVTGSCTWLSITMGDKVRELLIDCGMYQGGEEVDASIISDEPLVDPKKIDAILLTHAHLDHCGEIPYFYKLGYEGNVYASEETLKQASAIMYDCANINKRNIPADVLDKVEAMHAKAQHKPNKSKDDKLFEDIMEIEKDELISNALYLEEDVDEARKHFKPVEPFEKIRLFDGIYVRFVPNTHQNGATVIEVYAEYNGEKKSIAFSGDIGPSDSCLYKKMEYVPNEEIDYCVLESLHGTSEPEETFQESVHKLKKLIKKSVIRDGKTLCIGVFALDRSAMLLSVLNDFLRSGMNFSLWFDSPLGEIQLTNYITSRLKKNHKWFKEFEKDPFDCTHVRFSTYHKDHLQLVKNDAPKVVLVTSCMGYGGRILDYFNHHIQNDKTIFAFAGFLPDDSPSKILHEAENGKIVEVAGEKYVKHCETIRFHGFSSHGYYKEMMEFVRMYPNLKRIFLNHAPYDAKVDAKMQMQNEVSTDICIPMYGQLFEL